MSFFVKMTYSPTGNSWNLFSSSAFEGGSDPGVPQAEDGDNVLPPVESSDGGENINDMSSNEGVDQQTGNTGIDVDPARTFAGVDPRRT